MGDRLLIVSSFEALSYISENIKKYPENCLTTAMIIAYHMPNSFPSIELIAEKIGRCEKTVQRNLKTLEKLGLVKIQKRHRNSSIYTLILGDIAVSLKKPLGRHLGGSLGDIALSSLGDIQVSLQQTSNKQIKEEDLLNKDKSEKAKMDRKVYVDKLLNDFKSK